MIFPTAAARGFPPSRRLRRRSEFQAAQRRGGRKSGAHFVILALRNRRGAARLGVTVSRRVGRAVVRNRVKRRIREFYRRYAGNLAGTDTVVIARSGAAGLGFADTECELRMLFDHVARNRAADER